MLSALVPLQPLVQSAAAANQVSPDLINGIITVESSGNPNALSSAGAQGLMQVMPYNAPSGTNLYNADSNIQAGTSYLAGLINQYQGNIPDALAAYNEGPTNFNTYGANPQVQQYVKNVMSASGMYGNAPPSLWQDAQNTVTGAATTAKNAVSGTAQFFSALDWIVTNPASVLLVIVGLLLVVYSLAAVVKSSAEKAGVTPETLAALAA